MILGKPRTGKTTTAAELAKSLDLLHIEVQLLIQKIFLKIETYEPPEDLEDGQEVFFYFYSFFMFLAASIFNKA